MIIRCVGYTFVDDVDKVTVSVVALTQSFHARWHISHFAHNILNSPNQQHTCGGVLPSAIREFTTHADSIALKRMSTNGLWA